MGKKVSDETIKDKSCSKKAKKKNLCKSFMKFLFSHIGLLIFNIAYLLSGAYIFMLLEQHEEAKSCQEAKTEDLSNIVELKSMLLQYIQFNITSDPSILDKDNETTANAKIESMILNYRQNVTNNNYDGQGCIRSKWFFWNSLLFVFTIVTTIGNQNL